MYTLTIPNRTILETISKALELYARLGCNQWNAITSNFEVSDSTLLAFLEDNKPSLSIRNENVPARSKTAYDVLTVINYQLASEKPGVARNFNVWLQENPQVGSQPLCKINCANHLLNSTGFNVNFCFGGHVTNVQLKNIVDTNLQPVDLSYVERSTILDKLNNGEWLISLSDYLQVAQIEITDFDIARDY